MRPFPVARRPHLIISSRARSSRASSRVSATHPPGTGFRGREAEGSFLLLVFTLSTKHTHTCLYPYTYTCLYPYTHTCLYPTYLDPPLLPPPPLPALCSIKGGRDELVVVDWPGGFRCCRQATFGYYSSVCTHTHTHSRGCNACAHIRKGEPPPPPFVRITQTRHISQGHAVAPLDGPGYFVLRRGRLILSCSLSMQSYGKRPRQPIRGAASVVARMHVRNR